MFSYCLNNPVNMIDPTGEFAIVIPLIGIVIITALVIYAYGHAVRASSWLNQRIKAWIRNHPLTISKASNNKGVILIHMEDRDKKNKGEREKIKQGKKIIGNQGQIPNHQKNIPQVESIENINREIIR